MAFFLGQVLLQELLTLAVEEVVEAAVVVGATAGAAYVGARAIEATVNAVGDSFSSTAVVSSSPSGCFSHSDSYSSCGPFYLGEQKTIYDWWLNGLTTEEYEKLRDWGYNVRTECFPLEEAKSIIRCEAKVGQPPVNESGWEEKWEPPKNWDGKKQKVPNDRSKEKGYPHKNGDIWVPKDDMHGGPGWEVQHKDGRGHHHVYEDGTVRRH